MHVFGKFVAERHWLCMLQMGKARRIRLDMIVRLLEECLLQRQYPSHDHAYLITQVKSEIGRDLVIAAAACAKLST
jgi:hypothetical protein